MKRKAIICNSLNPDLVLYFKKKVEGLDGENVYLANRQVASKLGIRTSSFSTVSGLSWWLLVDCILSFYVLLYLFYKKVNYVIFDTAHISNIPLAVLCKLLGMKLVFTIHDWNPHEGAQSKAVTLYNTVVKKYLGDEFIVFSPIEFCKPIHKLTLAGFDFNGVSEKSDYFLFFGRVEPYKGLGHIVVLANLLIENGHDERIVVAGRGNDPALAELKKLPNVEVINRFIPDEEVASLFGACIATILPYDSATQSGVVILSYSFGKPVIAFNVGELGCYIENGVSGYLVQHKMYSEFFNKMMLVRSNYQRFSKGVVEYFEQFNSESLVRQYNNLLRKFN
ncbi:MULTISPECIES: glycosyltransferase [Shewanella]|uniref:glycosyltransferase n=1 Tax=Shewanella TaxID=22 RepID=UPI001F1CEAA5|nr:glycosyltransferase [Shewanella indica]